MFLRSVRSIGTGESFAESYMVCSKPAADNILVGQRFENQVRKSGFRVIKNHLEQVVCAQNRNRTCTPLREQDFESSASTSSAIWALVAGCNITVSEHTHQIFSLSETGSQPRLCALAGKYARQGAKARGSYCRPASSLSRYFLRK